jgi:flagellar basal body-associated protein FliL
VYLICQLPLYAGMLQTTKNVKKKKKKKKSIIYFLAYFILTLISFLLQIQIMFWLIIKQSNANARHDYVGKAMHALSITIAEIKDVVLQNLNTAQLLVPV